LGPGFLGISAKRGDIMEISGKNVVITGGARGLGRDYALHLKALGAKPYVLNLRPESLDAFKQATNIPGKAVDVSNEKEVEAILENYTQEYGPPDIVINNAGITADGLFIKKKGGVITKLSFAKWERVIDVNLNGTFLVSREAAYHMVTHGVKGLIINISSVCRRGNFGQINYSASKAAIDAMTVTMAKELSQYGIRVAAIAPGYINTEMCATIRQDVLDKIIKNVPMSRLGDPKEISHAVQFIVNNDYFTGRVLECDGGMTI
jgi:3-oxoacyl-[acyl-carrier protein] reductase